MWGSATIWGVVVRGFALVMFAVLKEVCRPHQ
eukprot:gene12274-biopygen6648